MAISFSESLKKATASTNSVNTMDLAAMDSKSVENNEGISTSSLDTEGNTIISYALDDDNWVRNDSTYEWDDEYSDLTYSSIDKSKNITVANSQISVSQEKNSQYIPFELDRYWDGVDLSKMTFIIHGKNKKQKDFRDIPINFQYNSTSIRFGWLLSENATSLAGELQFEVEAHGVNEKGKEYKWITKPNGKLNIAESLCGDGSSGTVKPSEDWLTTFLTQATGKVAEAQSAAQEAKNAAAEAQNCVDQALDAAIQAESVVNNAKTELEDSIDETIVSYLANYYDKEQIDALMENIDLSAVYETINNIDGLAKFNVEYDGATMTFYNGEAIIKAIPINSDPSVEWVTAYDAKVDAKISESVSVVQEDLDKYKTATDADLTSIHDEIDGLPETLQNDYYNKEATNTLLDSKADDTDIAAVNTEISSVKSTAETNKTNLATVSGKLAELEETVSGIDQSPRLTYDMKYGEDYTLTLEEIQGEGTADEVRSTKAAFVIQGGGSGGGTSSVLKIEYITTSPIVVTTNDTAIIRFIFSGTDSSGDQVTDGTATWRMGNTVITTSTVVSGENSFDVTDYISIGTQKITLSITDDAGSLVTKSWTVQKIDIRLESTFNDQLTYPVGTVSFNYTPYGAVSKDIHFILDGSEIGTVTTTSSGIPMSYTLPSQTHGAHLLDVYMTAVINNSTIESNHISKDIIWYDSTSDVPVISCVQQNITAKQYDTTNIIYSVYDPKTETPKVTLSVDGEVVSTLTLDSNTQTWQYKSTEVGTHTLMIACGATIKTLTVIVEKLDIDIAPVTAGLAFDFNPVGRSNNDTDRLWSDGDVSMTVSANFDWVNGGYQIDENGDQYFCIKAGTSAVIDYKLFEDDAKRNGKEFKLIFKTTNVRKADAMFLKCLDGTASQIGIQMNVHEAYIHASAGNLYLPYSEEDVIEFEFNINKNTDSIPMVMGYEDGVATRPMIYSDSHDFTQINPQVITIGS